MFPRNWQTFAHFLKASVGTGVLAMPSAFAHAGYVNGTILTLIIGSLALYCLHILVGFSCLLIILCQLIIIFTLADQMHVHLVQTTTSSLCQLFTGHESGPQTRSTRAALLGPHCHVSKFLNTLH